MARPHKRKLRNYLLNRKYQLRYTAIMVLISALLTGALGYVWYKQVRETSRTVEVKALGSLSEAAVQHIRLEMKEHDRLRLLVLAGFGLAFALAVAIYGIVLTHKVAGPLYKVGTYMQHIADGELGPIDNIRRGDHLHEFYDQFKTMHGNIRARTADEVDTIRAAIAALESDDPSTRAAALQQLTTLCEQKDASLRS